MRRSDTSLDGSLDNNVKGMGEGGQCHSHLFAIFGWKYVLVFFEFPAFIRMRGIT